MTKKLINPNPGCWESDGGIVIADTGLFKSLIANAVIDVDSCDDKKITDQQAQANAKMMASAPKMREMLSRAITILKIKTPKEDEITWLQITKMKETIEAAELWVDE